MLRDHTVSENARNKLFTKAPTELWMSPPLASVASAGSPSARKPSRRGKNRITKPTVTCFRASATSNCNCFHVFDCFVTASIGFSE